MTGGEIPIDIILPRPYKVPVPSTKVMLVGMTFSLKLSNKQKQKSLISRETKKNQIYYTFQEHTIKKPGQYLPKKMIYALNKKVRHSNHKCYSANHSACPNISYEKAQDILSLQNCQRVSLSTLSLSHIFSI
jgi:hypothetical protein